MKRFILYISLFLCFPVLLIAGSPEITNSYGPTIGNSRASELTNENSLFGFFNKAKLKMDHSYSYYFSTTAKKSNSLGLYLNTLNYQISQPLLFKIKWGIAFSPQSYSTAKTSNYSGGSLVMPSFELHYRPSENFRFSIQYSALPSFQQNYFLR